MPSLTSESNLKPIAIECLREVDDDGWIGSVLMYYARGHFDPAIFVEAIDREHGQRFTSDLVQHTYRRVAPLKILEGWWTLEECGLLKSDAFACTILNVP
jgi:hypothetical protein